ncbi:MAG: hypothetical protein QOE70_4349 [Chthoniobacter sp.]|jgi:Flp pilus assembly protein TadB|nr:hypothetical protein [Chthoniobacter sp.]
MTWLQILSLAAVFALALLGLAAVRAARRRRRFDRMHEAAEEKRCHDHFKGGGA